MGSSICHLVKDLIFGILPKGINDTFISIIPKIYYPQSMMHFRHKRLFNTLYKVILEVIVSRLKPIMRKIICLNQSSFIRGKQIINNIVILQ